MYRKAKFILLCLFMTFAYSNTVFAECSNPDFRNVCWGMGMYEVLKREGGIYRTDSKYNEVTYNVSYFGTEANLIYRFGKDGGLLGATYSVDGAEIGNKSKKFLEFYNLALANLEKIYGEPILFDKGKSLETCLWEDENSFIALLKFLGEKGEIMRSLAVYERKE